MDERYALVDVKGKGLVIFSAYVVSRAVITPLQGSEPYFHIRADALMQGL